LTVGYSGTPLAKKLGLKEGQTVCLHDAPPEWREWMAPMPPGLAFAARAGKSVDLLHGFFVQRSELKRSLAAWRGQLGDEATLWISWPKKAAKVDTDISEDVIRAEALPLGFVDVKVCAVGETWSGLKLVVRKELRGGGARVA